MTQENINNIYTKKRENITILAIDERYKFIKIFTVSSTLEFQCKQDVLFIRRAYDFFLHKKYEIFNVAQVHL